MRTLVMKFGGSTLARAEGLTQLVGIVLYERERWDRLMLVVSALEGVTDQLIDAAHLAQFGQQRGYRRIVSNLRQRHLSLAESLPLDQTERSILQTNIDTLLSDLLAMCESLSNAAQKQAATDLFDAIIGVGERLTARIVAALLRHSDLRSVALDTTDLIITDNVRANARPDMEATRERMENQLLPMLERGILPVLTGFIGGTTTGKPTTLGRGGSDYTAAILGVCANATEIWIWTHVNGVMSADPHEVKDARVIHQLSIIEATEMAFFGTRVLHPRMLLLMRGQNISLRVRNLFAPQQPGTLVHNSTPELKDGLQAVTSIGAIALKTNSGGSLANITTLVDSVFFDTIGTQVEVTITTQSPSHTLVCFVVPIAAGHEAIHTLNSALEDHLQGLSEWQVEPVTIVTVIGAQDAISLAGCVQIMDALANIPILAIDYSPARCGISMVINVRDTELALKRLHKHISK
ncbi:MAG: aspartate kinase [Anaerolineae bacterium]|nr:aspartate kinase [Anaerolineae bacterium]